MRWRRVAAMSRKEFIQIRRDSRSLITVLLMPVMLMLLMGYGTSLDIKHIPLIVYDREGSQQSQDLLRRFAISQYFELVRTVDSYSALTRAIDSGECRLGLVIPHDFSRLLKSGQTAAVQALLDGTDSNAANIAIGYAQGVVQGYANDIRLEWMGEHGLPQQPIPLTVDARAWFNEDLESRNFIIPGVAAMVMAVLGTLLTSLTISREWERGTMEQLISTPVSAAEIMLGKLMPYFAIGLLDTALCVVIGVGWFEVPFRGTLAILFATSSLFLVVVMGIGFVVSVLMKSQLATSQIALIVTFLPAFLLSGFAFPIGQMPAPIRAVTTIVSARYYVTILQNVFLKGTGFGPLAQPVAALGIYAAVVAFVAIRSFHKSLD